MMSIEAAVCQFDLCTQRLLKDFPFQAADAPILFRQLLVRAIILPQNRQGAVNTDFDVIPPAQERIPQPPHPLVQRSLTKSSQAGNESIPNSRSDRLPDGRIGQVADLAPQNQGQIAVVVSQLPQTLLGYAINIVRPSASGTNQFAGDESASLQPPEPLPNCRRRHSDRGANVLDRFGTDTVQFIEELPVRLFEHSFHSERPREQHSSTHCGKTAYYQPYANRRPHVEF